jgi:uncharacterized protein (TIGR00288 family)
MAAIEKSQVATLIDFENVVIAAEKEHGEFRLTAILNAIAQQGRLVVKRAYGDWSRFYRYQSDLTQNAVDLIQLYSVRLGSSKNAADIQIAIDAMEVVFSHPQIHVFAIVSGDSDFTALVRKLRSYGKYVIGVGLRSSTSELLVRACDEFLLYENLVGKSSRTAAFDKERARDVLMRALRQLISEGQTEAPTTRLKQVILNLDSTFDEVNLGYKQFEDFLQEQGDLLGFNLCGVRPAVVQLRSDTLSPSTLFALEGRASLENQYRDGLMTAGLSLVDPETRHDILRDLFQLLQINPARLTLNQAEEDLKQQYDAENILRSREVVREVVKLAYRSACLQFASGVPTLAAAVSLLPGISQQQFVDRTEATYIKALMDQNLPLDDKTIASVLYGTVDEALRVQSLRNELTMMKEGFQGLVTGRLMESPLVELFSQETLTPVLRDVQGFQPDESPTLLRAVELVNQGMSVRLRDFSAGADLFLKAFVMQKMLVEQGEPGASIDDAKWYLASYCSARAGQHFFSHDYTAARQYYLGFFAISQDTEPFYAKVKNLTRPMLSYYFTIAANEHGVLLDRSPSQIAPARMAAILCNHPDVRVARTWRDLARDLGQVNKGIISLLIKELDDVVEIEAGQIDQTRVYLSSLLV